MSAHLITGTATVPLQSLAHVLSLMEVLELEDWWDDADEAAFTALVEAAKQVPTLTQLVEAGCERVCMGCDTGAHGEGQHRLDVEPVVLELIDRGWLAVNGPGEWS